MPTYRIGLGQPQDSSTFTLETIVVKLNEALAEKGPSEIKRGWFSGIQLHLQYNYQFRVHPGKKSKFESAVQAFCLNTLKEIEA